ncbi:MAG: T9SS type A sorting domain-containing protein [Chitinophagales bacterium]|nr:T9SS type A sorting domain-containing protein [Chitinophagales bacterium]
MLPKYGLLIALLVFSIMGTKAQFVFEAAGDIPVVSDSQILNFAWAGGLNNPQFSTIDVNLDGIDDLLVFDRTSSKPLIFLRSSIPDTISYHLDLQFPAFPETLKNWVLARDYNCDQKADLFVHDVLGISIYKNVSTSNFALQKFNKGKQLKSDYGSGEVVLLVSGNDIPAIDDIDGDGDLDILTFSFFDGSFIEYHQNQSVELYGNCDSMKFILADPCWGKIEENNTTNAVTLSVSCKGATTISSHSRHVGSTLTTLDIQRDAVKDLLLGDITFSKMTLLINGGDSSSAFITSQDANFPDSDIPVSVSEFPAAFNVDVNLDGRLDLVIAPNSQATEDQENAWLYLDKGVGDTSDFHLTTPSFFTEDMIDVGSGSQPVIVSYNYDALDDVLIANAYSYDNGSKISQIDAYVNVGTNSQPQLELFREDVGGVSAFGWEQLKITFADLDGDNDPDMIVGNEQGEIHYFEHFIGIVPEPVFVHNDSFLGPLIDIGLHAAPYLYDVNGDGLFDLIIGEANGRINYYENTGSVSQPEFTFITDHFGKIDVSGAQSNGFCVPHIFEHLGEKFLIAGSESGEVFLYSNLSNILNSQFDQLSDNLFSINLGTRTAPLMWNYNEDANPDFLVGNSSGGIHLLKGSVFNSIHELVDINPDPIVFPNPCYDRIVIRDAGIERIKLFNLNGKELLHSAETILDVQDLKPAVYILKAFYRSGDVGTVKIVKL